MVSGSRIQCVALGIFLLGSNLEAQCQAFEDVAQELGIIGSYTGNYFAGGISFVDFDGDGLDDLTFATNTGHPLRFFRNTNPGFTEVFLNVNNTKLVMQVLWVDYDNDGDKDLFTTSLLEGSDLYRNNGNLNFQNVNFISGLQVLFNPMISYGASFGDIDNDGWLDLYIVNRNNQGNQPNLLFRNNGDGTFLDITMDLGMGQEFKYEFCSTFFDFNNDNLLDIYIANDKCRSGGNSLFKNLGGLSFEDISEISDTDICMSAMCVTVGDYNNDGFSDLYITNSPPGSFMGDVGFLAEYGNKLLLNGGDETFTEVSNALGVDFNIWTWASDFFDFDNDGDLDLYVIGADVLIGHGPNRLFRNEEGISFTSLDPLESMIGDNANSYSFATGDLDNDGYMDVVLNNKYPYEYNVWRNLGEGSNWVKFGVQGLSSNKDGIGSRIEIYSVEGFQMRTLQCGEGYLNQNSNKLHFGVQEISVVDSVIVKWSSGIVNTIYGLQTNRTYCIVEDTVSSVIDCLPLVDFEFVGNGTELSFEVSDWDGLTEILWTMGDGSVFTLDELVHSYADTSTYQVCLTLSNACGSSSYCQDISVSMTECVLVAGFGLEQSADTLFFTDQSAGDPNSWEWNMGEGSFASGSEGYFVFELPGIYEVCLLVSNSCAQDSLCSLVLISPEDCAPTANFEYDQFGDSIAAFSSSLEVDSILWIIDNEIQIPDLLQLEFTFQTFGTHQVCLIAFNQCSSDTLCMEIIILESDCAPISDFNFVQDGQEIQFMDSSLDADSMVWSFGDGEFSNAINPVHSYTSSGTFQVCQEVFNDCSSDSSCASVSLLLDGLSRSDIHSWKIYPNPASDHIFLGLKIKEQLKVALFTTQGSLVWSSGLISPQTLTHRLNIDVLSRGLYILQVIGDYSSTQSMLLIE